MSGHNDRNQVRLCFNNPLIFLLNYNKIPCGRSTIRGFIISDLTKELDILKQLFENLSDADKQDFLTSVSQKEQIKKVIEPRKITNCPHCQSTHFVKNGKDCGSWRYLCRNCKKSFVEQTAIILFGSQKAIETWEKYIHCMIEKYPLHKCATICKINLATALLGDIKF